MGERLVIKMETKDITAACAVKSNHHRMCRNVFSFAFKMQPYYFQSQIIIRLM